MFHKLLVYYFVGLLGLEGIISFSVMIIIGIVGYCIGGESMIGKIVNEINGIIDKFMLSLLCIIIFMFVLVTKKSTQFHVTKMSSAMTRKLFQQFYPIGVWFLCIICLLCY